MNTRTIQAGGSWKPLAEEVIARLQLGTVILLSGPLGAGKTTFVQTLAHELGSKDIVKSPTFTLRNTYTLRQASYKRLVHIDAYRIEHPREAMALGIEDELATPGTILAIEWPEHLPASAIQNAHAVRVRIEVQEDGTRVVTME